jgi:hypothetical protein
MTEESSFIKHPEGRMQDVSSVKEIILIVQHYGPDSCSLLVLASLDQVLTRKGNFIYILEEVLPHLHLSPHCVPIDRHLFLYLLPNYAQSFSFHLFGFR